MDDVVNKNMEIFIGCDTDIKDRVADVFEAYAKSVNFMGKSGAGQHTVLCN
jgi:3-hydroxyisobutyrate dehydrogenase-like beta-hydroxyacid dehydrogenase